MKKVFPIRIDDEMRARLEKIAADRDRTVAYLIREAIEQYLQQKKLKAK